MEAGMSTCYTYKQPFEYAWDGLQSMRKCITVGPGYITKNLNLGISVTKKYNASSLHSGPQCKQFCEHLHNCWKYFRNYFSRSWLEYGLYHVPLSGSQMLLSCLCRRLNAGRHHICIINLWLKRSVQAWVATHAPVVNDVAAFAEPSASLGWHSEVIHYSCEIGGAES